ncbi:MAG: ATP-dependent Clp protease adapter ClpS [Xanthomonadaceae bacterium]|nr:ATP-dependent Clp protease adapter ClpS [Xanthomonadaceae bacterium]
MEHDEDSDVAVTEAPPEVSEPPKYAVVLLNDDYTTMEFVILVLQKYFKKSSDEAHAIMLKIHHEGRGTAGIYSHEIAETKANQVVTHAKVKGFPLQCIVELTGGGKV